MTCVFWETLCKYKWWPTFPHLSICKSICHSVDCYHIVLLSGTLTTNSTRSVHYFIQISNRCCITAFSLSIDLLFLSVLHFVCQSDVIPFVTEHYSCRRPVHSVALFANAWLCSILMEMHWHSVAISFHSISHVCLMETTWFSMQNTISMEYHSLKVNRLWAMLFHYAEVRWKLPYISMLYCFLEISVRADLFSVLEVPFRGRLACWSNHWYNGCDTSINRLTIPILQYLITVTLVCWYISVLWNVVFIKCNDW